MKKTYIVFCFLLLSAFALKVYPETPDEIFGNMTYMLVDKDHLEKVTLVNGKYMDPFLCVYYEGDFVYGDFNSDGLKDAAVVIYDSGGGSGYFLNLTFLINDGKKLVHESSHSLGYKTFVTSLIEQQGKIVVEMLVPDERDGSGRFPRRMRKVYEYYGPEVRKEA